MLAFGPMKKFALIIALFGFVAAVSADDLNLKIEGMVCESGCVKKVNDALTKVKGVSDKKVELGSAQISYDAKKTSPKQIMAAIEKAGFTIAKK